LGKAPSKKRHWPDALNFNEKGDWTMQKLTEQAKKKLCEKILNNNVFIDNVDAEVKSSMFQDGFVFNESTGNQRISIFIGAPFNVEFE
tara:strand:+ start:5855 stop:6118 length:264 start_codon:yes stop_codon:yes gene_type:complete